MPKIRLPGNSECSGEAGDSGPLSRPLDTREARAGFIYNGNCCYIVHCAVCTQVSNTIFCEIGINPVSRFQIRFFNFIIWLDKKPDPH